MLWSASVKGPVAGIVNVASAARFHDGHSDSPEAEEPLPSDKQLDIID
jgi:hypothetical protein